MGPEMMNGWGGWGGMPFGGLFMLLFWAVVIAALIVLIRWLMGWQGRADKTGDSALDILKQRFARGEIDEQEYEKRRQKLVE